MCKHVLAETVTDTTERMIAVIEDRHTTPEIRDSIVESVTKEINGIVSRLKFGHSEVIRKVYPLLKNLEARGHVWRADETPIGDIKTSQ